tara:strand:+ start:468 stop:1718 length:1251 start_codon:yes stop_codon:yes gene_type:complete
MKKRTVSLCLLLLHLVTGPAFAQIHVRPGGAALEPGIGMQQRDLIEWTDLRAGDTLFPVSVNNWWGYMNHRGRLIVFPDFDWTDHFYDGLARAVVNGKTGYLSGNGSWVHEPIYPYADRFQEGRAIVGDGEHFGFIEKSGDILVPVQLDGALRFREGLAAVMKDDLCGYINVAGDLEIPARFASARSFHEGYAAVTMPGPEGSPTSVGYIDRRGKVVFSDSSGDVLELGDFNEGLAAVKGRKGWGYLSKNWRIRIKPDYQEARDFTNGLAAVKTEGKWGLIDKTGRFVIQPRYDSIDDMDDKLIMVVLDGKVGYINRVGKEAIVPQFHSGLPFHEGLARVGVDPSFGYITITGNAVWDPRQAVNGFINKRAKERAAIRGRERVIHHRTVDAPEYRDPRPSGYPPDHLYEEVLPARD